MLGSPITYRVLHLALSTYPSKNEEQYLKHIDSIYSNFISERNRYSEELPPKEAFLYKPLKYHLFGHFDIAYISIIDSYKFAQMVFDNPQDDKTSYNNVSYQIQCGTILRHSNILLLSSVLNENNYDYIYNKYPFVEIINLKLNNGLLIGNGNNFSELVLNKLELIFGDKKDFLYIISNSFGWTDLTILMLSPQIDLIIDKTLKLRRLIVSDLFDTEDKAKGSLLVANSLFKKKFNYKDSEIIKAHIFLDTHSNIGVPYNLFSNKEESDNSLMDQLFLTSIEWQIKPGHFRSFFKEINKNEVLFSKDIYYKTGKTDFITHEVNPSSIISNKKVFMALRDTEARNHIRRLKTKPLFQLKLEDIDDNSSCPRDVDRKLSFNQIKELREINEAMKKLKLSRQLRIKIHKAFHNYNNGITDSISYVYFIDFFGFLNFFKNLIFGYAKEIDLLLAGNYNEARKMNLSNVEENFDVIVQSFEEAYIDRFLNNYNFEELNDFKIDFNTSITQLITTYDAIIKELSFVLLIDDPKILVRQNELNTKSNLVSINFNVFHLIEPPLIFNTVVKELLNNLRENFIKDPIELERFKESESIIRMEFCKFQQVNTIFEDFDFRYFEIDVIKYMYTFNFNTELYYFWSWVYFFQNTSVFNTLGYVDRVSFDKELFRVMLIIGTFDRDKLMSNDLNYPIPEVYDYWEASYQKIKKIIIQLIDMQSFIDLVKILINRYKEIVKIEMPSQAKNGIHTHLKNELKKEDFKEIKEEIALKSRRKFILKKLMKYLDTNELEGIEDIEKRWKTLEYSYAVYNLNLQNCTPLLYNSPSTNIETISEPSSTMFFNRISYTTLLWYFKKMNGSINLLKREPKTGKPIYNFIDKNDKTIYAFVDPQGDFFIINNEARKETMKFKHAVYHSLWHLGLVMKLNHFNLQNLENGK